MSPEPDGTLHDWGEIEDAYEWDTLLLGNGLSVNAWEPFGYGELHDYAGGSKILTAADRALFAGPPNFERVLGELLDAIRVNDCVGVETAPLLARYRNIQLALGHAVREVTSYDLLLYWAIACRGKFDPFVDLFHNGDVAGNEKGPAGPAGRDLRAARGKSPALLRRQVSSAGGPDVRVAP